jgi:hypothetical protein
MSKLTPVQATEKHSRRLKGSIEDIRLGVNRVTVAPTLKAAEKIDKMKMKWLAAVDSGKVERGLKRVSLDEWKTKTVNKGLNRIGAGIDEAKDKMEAFYGELFPFQDTLVAQVQKLPDITLEDNIGRMTTFVRGMAKFKRKG